MSKKNVSVKSGLDVSKNLFELKVRLNGIDLKGTVQKEALAKCLYTIANGAVTSKEVIAAAPSLILFYEAQFKKDANVSNYPLVVDIKRVTLGSDANGNGVIRWYQDQYTTWSLGDLYAVAKIARSFAKGLEEYSKIAIPEPTVRSEAPGKATGTKSTKAPKVALDFATIEL